MKYFLLVVALLLLLPAALTSGAFGPTRDDVALAVVPVVRLPLDVLKKAEHASIVFDVPATLQWSRLRGSWGDPDYMVFAVAAGDSSVLPWSALGIDVGASTQAGPSAVAAATFVPYGYSAGANDVGVVIRPRAGDRVRLDFKVLVPDVAAAGDVVVQPQWNGMKDHLVGAALDLNVGPHIRVMAVLGVLLLGAAAILRD